MYKGKIKFKFSKFLVYRKNCRVFVKVSLRIFLIIILYFNNIIIYIVYVLKNEDSYVCKIYFDNVIICGELMF